MSDARKLRGQIYLGNTWVDVHLKTDPHNLLLLIAISYNRNVNFLVDGKRTEESIWGRVQLQTNYLWTRRMDVENQVSRKPRNASFWMRFRHALMTFTSSWFQTFVSNQDTEQFSEGGQLRGDFERTISFRLYLAGPIIDDYLQEMGEMICSNITRSRRTGKSSKLYTIFCDALDNCSLRSVWWRWQAG